MRQDRKSKPETAASMCSASDRAYQAIRESISKGDLRQGERLKEADLVELCKVSRTPIRDALRRLETEGIVTITPNAGAVLAIWSETELSDLFAVRARVEGMAAAFAARRRTEDDLRKLQTIADAFSALVEGSETSLDHTEIAETNGAFHRAIVSVARSRAISVASAQVMDIPIMLRTFRHYERRDLARSAAQHLEITEAVRVQDADWAQAVMSAHIRAGFQALNAGRRMVGGGAHD